MNKILPSPQTVEISDTGDLVEAIAAFDRRFFQGSKDDIAGRKKVLEEREVHSLLHLVWNPQRNALYPNIGLEARGPDRNWIHLKENLELALPPDSSITITIDAGC